ncbi:hypothetical protein B6V74_14785 [Thioclava sp. F42-5]|nr:hypothetical protein B6V74_14785 [Thioclava sp. F42-5]
MATDRADGEPYLLSLIEKTGAAVDRDVARILADTVRRVRGVLARKTAREVLLEVIDLVEDDREIGIRLAGADGTLATLTGRSRRMLENAARTLSGRASIWRQIARLVRGLGHLHAADLVHGGIADGTIFTVNIEPLELKLGGYEGCIHVGSLGSGGAGLLRPGTVVSHSQDWRDLGTIAARLLLQSDADRTALLPLEQRLLDRLRVPPQFAFIEGDALAAEIEELCSELERVGSSGRYELVVAPARDLFRRDAPALTRGLIAAADTDALLAFIQEDLTANAPQAWRNPGRRDGTIQVFSQRAVYDVRPLAEDDRIARITGCRVRGQGDGAIASQAIDARVHVARDLQEARDRVARTGGGAMAWKSVGADKATAPSAVDPVEWHALVLIEVAALFERRLHHYPAEIVDAPEPGLVRVAARTDAERDRWRAKFGRMEAAAELQREMLRNDGTVEWTLTVSDALTLGPTAPKLSLEDVIDEDGRRLYVFRHEGNLPVEARVLLRPRPDRGTETQIRRRLRHVVVARDNIDLLRAIGNPRSVGLDPALNAMAAPGFPPDELDPSKTDAWEAICRGHSIDLVVGPPGVGKTFLVSRLVGSILTSNPTARVLIAAQNHDALAEMERKLREHFSEVERDPIIVRIERPDPDLNETQLRDQARTLLDAFVLADTSPLSRRRREAVERVLSRRRSEGDVDPEGEAILRDTEHLILRSADVTLATANSSVIEEMVAEGEQFDWVIVEEAARASGPELIGALLLGARRVLIGDHRQLAPFDAERKARLYRDEAGEALVTDAPELIDAVSDLPDEVGRSLDAVARDPKLRADVLGAALRLEQPFREIAEATEEMTSVFGGPVSMLTEQSRMHPAICGLVSNTFYGGRLTTVDRIADRPCPITPASEALSAPVVLLDLPPLSRARVRAFETFDGTSPSNRAEATALFEALDRLGPTKGATPTLAILSPYTAQCRTLQARVTSRIDRETGLLSGFASPKGDGVFVQTVNSFQGGEADLVMVSTVRNNQKMGRHALGIVGDRRLMNVLLSRAKHKLVLVTSAGFLKNAIKWSEPERGSGHGLEFLGALLRKIEQMSAPDDPESLPSASIIACSENGKVIE